MSECTRDVKRDLAILLEFHEWLRGIRQPGAKALFPC